MKKTLFPLLLFLISASLWANNTIGPTPTPPSDPVALFNGNGLDAWTGNQGGRSNWKIENEALVSQPGSGPLTTRQSYADCELHLEARGSAEVLLQGRYPVTLSNGTGPASDEWQIYDITFRAPRFNNDGSLKSSALITVLRNGVITQNHVEVKSDTGSAKHGFKQALVLRAQTHPSAFRNIQIRELGVQQLLNGKDLTGWYSYLEKLGRNNDPEGNFKIVDGILHIEGKNFGYVATERSFANYYLKAVFKWGQHQYPPRATGKRDSGILYHFPEGERDNVWPKSIECQVQETDCGDFWCVGGTNVESLNHSAIEWNQKRIYRTENFELSNGEWNTIEIICNGDQVEHYVNGHLVNSGTEASVSSGKILLQSEGAEVYYRSVELIPY